MTDERDAGDEGLRRDVPTHIYAHDYEYIKKVPWRIGDYGERGIFTEEQKAQLALRFDLTPELVDELSLLVGNNLDADSLTKQVKASKEKSTARGAKRLEDAAKHARKLRHHHSKLNEQLQTLGTDFDPSGRAAGRLEKLRADVAQVDEVLQGLEAQIDALKGIPDSVAARVPDDKGETLDGRRKYVVFSCCYIWRDAGHRVSYTTDPSSVSGSTRKGPLIDFVNAVVRRVTDPPNELSPETIRRHIDDWKITPEEEVHLFDP